MIVTLTSATDIVDSLHAFFRQQSVSEVLLLLYDLEGVNEGVLEQTRSLEAIRWLGHENASDSHHVARSALTRDFTLCNDLDHSWDVSDGHLVTRLLNLDVLIGEEPRRLDLEDELAVHFVGLALLGRALHDWVELL